MSKIILVTGGNAGIGFELVKLLAAKPEVAKVYVGARNAAAGKEAARLISKETGKDVDSIQLDVTDSKSIKAAKATIEKHDGRLDVLVNNAGISEMDKDQNASTIDVDIVRRTMETNLFGLIQTTLAFVPLLRKSPCGVILNVSTDMASNTLMSKQDFLHTTAYNTSKAAANSYTISLAHELKGDNIKVNAVTPGFTSTKINGFREGGKTPKQGAESLLPWALLDKSGPTGLFLDEHGKEFPW